MLGKLVHIGFDALLITALLAGIKRSTGLTPALSQVPNKDVRQWLNSYLEMGEYAFDFAVVILGVTTEILLFRTQEVDRLLGNTMSPHITF